MNKPIMRKVLKILSNGSLTISFNYFLDSKQVLLSEKDNKTFILNKKQNSIKIQKDEFSNYKKKYLV
jgi:hypothetical protein